MSLYLYVVGLVFLLVIILIFVALSFRIVREWERAVVLRLGRILALKGPGIILGFNVVLVNPKGTTNSEEHDRVMREKGFDRHTASAYLIALKGLGMLNDIK